MELSTYNNTAEPASPDHGWTNAYEARVEFFARQLAEVLDENRLLRDRNAWLEAHSYPSGRSRPLTWLRGWFATLLDEVAL